MINRKLILESCIEKVRSKANALANELNAMQNDGASNSKSTAGDKHDTEREMLNQEITKLLSQAANENRLLYLLESIPKEIQNTEVQNGSIVLTNRGIFLIGSPCGKMEIDHFVVFGLSIQSPLALRLMGKKSDDCFDLNHVKYQVIEIN